MAERVYFLGDTCNNNEIKQNICPCCGSSELSYGVMEHNTTYVSYPWKCLKCGSDGEENLDLVFGSHTIIKDMVLTKLEHKENVDAAVTAVLQRIGRSSPPDNYHQMIEFVSKETEGIVDYDVLEEAARNAMLDFFLRN